MASFVVSSTVLLILLGLCQVCGFFLVADSSRWRQHGRNIIKELEEKRRMEKLIDYLDYETSDKDYAKDQGGQLNLNHKQSTFTGSFGPWRGKRNEVGGKNERIEN
ncbi:uncharacterized protein LOC121385688 [Gigantopelta aegis]|uniref:uncharacterized protein LOC121385688 n=1 Tax=Gigantopelta aegis TaxID=1735272 RepID=UPI001B88859C|nr:uncharacterized protein LOC121385688 [Gigantopelta aegis]XP_041372393.1 uncharacterized protein LOC121385688 [Gigantopelta aegis]